MPRLPRGPRPASSATEDRKAIEQRARDAAIPFAPEKKGQWPFPIEDIDGGDNSDSADSASSANGLHEVNNAGDHIHASDQNNACDRNGKPQQVQGGQANQ